MKRILLVCILTTTLLLTGCFGSSSSTSSSTDGFNSAASQSYDKASDGDYGSAAYAADDLDSQEDDGINQDTDSYDDTNMNESDISDENASDEVTDVNEASDVNEVTDSDNSDQTEAQASRKQKLVYTCEMTMETLEFDQTIQSIKESIDKYDGIIEQENQSDSNSYWYRSGSSYGSLSSSLVIRIPTENYLSFLDELDGNGKITYKNMQVENITKHYSEVQTTIQSLQTQEKRLLQMMEDAESIDDMIKVESRLTEVQNELAQYKNTLADLDTDVAYSTINLSVNEVKVYEVSEPNFLQRLSSTIEESKDLFLSFLEHALYVIILFGPILLFILIVVIIVHKIYRKIRPAKKKNREKKAFFSKLKKGDKNDSATETNPDEPDK